MILHSLVRVSINDSKDGHVEIFAPQFRWRVSYKFRDLKDVRGAPCTRANESSTV